MKSWPAKLRQSNKAHVSSLWALLIVLLAQPARGFFIDSRQSPRTSEWSYANQLEWVNQSGECARQAQSPIDIEHTNVIVSNKLHVRFYNYDRQLRFKLMNAHHTIKMDPVLEAGDGHALEPAVSGSALNATTLRDIIAADEYADFVQPVADSAQQRTRLNVTGLGALGRGEGAPDDARQTDADGQAPLPYGGAPTIKLDWLDEGQNEFKLRDIHFHWGERRDNGSEHAIDGRRAAMEMHLVHIKHGLDKSAIGSTSDSVAVIAVLIESHRKSNADFNPIVNELIRINATDQAQEVEYKSIMDLLPSNLNAFYYYSGSLTTPPCYQVVNWLVMAERLNMNAKQIEMFRNLYAPHSHMHLHATAGDDGDEHEDGEKLIVPNVRSLQPLNNRLVRASFVKHGSRIETAWSGAGSLNSAHKLFYHSSAFFNLLLSTILQPSGKDVLQLLAVALSASYLLLPEKRAY